MSTITATTDEAGPIDGMTIGLRAVDPADWAALHALLDGLSDHARYLRFLRALPEIPDWAVDSLCRVDDDVHVARLAVTEDGRVAGIAQFFVDPDVSDAAEVAVTIATPFQRRGLGRILLHAIAVEASARRIGTFTYSASPGNRPAVQLMRSLGARSRFTDGLITGHVPVDLLRRRSGPCDEPRHHTRAIA